jgi:TRAP-type C4-dicarboxylate transport system substrate-binding protein
MHRRRSLALLGGLAASCALGPIPAALAQEAVRIRLGTLVPKGSSYHRAMQEMAERWKKAQGASATFTVFTDGTQGGEIDMVRRMRVGQLNAALISVVGLAEIDRSVTALQYMPMLFRDWGEVDYVLADMHEQLEARFLDKGFVVLFWGDGGWVRYFSKEPMLHPADLRKHKLWAWNGDPAAADIMKSMGYSPVPLETADILPGLQTGLITAVPSAAFFALAGQFDTVAKCMLDVKWAPVLGAGVITRRAWDSMSPPAQLELKRAAAEAGAKIRAQARKEDQEAVDAMRKRGLKVYPGTPELEAEWRGLAEEAYPKIRGRMVPADLFDRVQGLVQDYRAHGGKTAARS